jgi:hypothetical protein
MNMNRMVLKSTVGSDGTLHLELALGADAANKEVQVIVEPATGPTMTQEEWRAFILSTAGGWQGEFERPDQGEYEKRDPLP